MHYAKLAEAGAAATVMKSGRRRKITCSRCLYCCSETNERTPVHAFFPQFIESLKAIICGQKHTAERCG